MIMVNNDIQIIHDIISNSEVTYSLTDKKKLENKTAFQISEPEISEILSDELDVEAEIARIIKDFSENPHSDPDVFLEDLSFYLIRTIIIFSANQRRSALHDRMAAREQARSELLQQAEKMKEAAAEMRTGALLTLGLSLAGSIRSLQGSYKAIKASSKEITLIKENASAEKIHQTEMDNLNKIGSHVSDPKDTQSVSQQISTLKNKQQQLQKDTELQAAMLKKDQIEAKNIIAQGDQANRVSSFNDSRYQANIKERDAEAARLGANAQYEQQQTDLKKEFYDSLNERIRDLINIVKALNDNKIDEMRAISKR